MLIGPETPATELSEVDEGLKAQEFQIWDGVSKRA